MVWHEIQRRLLDQGRDGARMQEGEIAALDADVDELVSAIRQCPNFRQASPLLTELGELQTLLATLAFKYRVPLSPKQRRLVRQFDRWDDPDLRAAVFAAVKKDRFPW